MRTHAHTRTRTRVHTSAQSRAHGPTLRAPTYLAHAGAGARDPDGHRRAVPSSPVQIGCTRQAQSTARCRLATEHSAARRRPVASPRRSAGAVPGNPSPAAPPAACASERRRFRLQAVPRFRRQAAGRRFGMGSARTARADCTTRRAARRRAGTARAATRARSRAPSPADIGDGRFRNAARSDPRPDDRLSNGLLDQLRCGTRGRLRRCSGLEAFLRTAGFANSDCRIDRYGARSAKRRRHRRAADVVGDVRDSHVQQPADANQRVRGREKVRPDDNRHVHRVPTTAIAIDLRGPLTREPRGLGAL
jgi:hypothetical protein